MCSSGKEHNFKTYDDTLSSALGVPYDYGSVMHYSKTAFNIASDPTIVTKIPEFMDVIGQRTGFSVSDLTKLNRLYNCSELSVTRAINGPADAEGVLMNARKSASTVRSF